MSAHARRRRAHRRARGGASSRWIVACTAMFLLAMALAVGFLLHDPNASVGGAGVEAEANAAAADHALPLVIVHKSPGCVCCGRWIAHLREAGFAVDIRDGTVAAARARLGVPPGVLSCHTSEVDGYFVEGHVPADDIRRLLAERPAARGIALPGMPLGSPGMDAAPAQQIGYQVLLITPDGGRDTFSSHPPAGR